jgi:hypothetical protein
MKLLRRLDPPANRTLFVEDGGEPTRIPSGPEFTKRIEGVRVLNAEASSEAETAWL